MGHSRKGILDEELAKLIKRRAKGRAYWALGLEGFGVGNIVWGELDGAGVDRREEAFGKGEFGHGQWWEIRGLKRWICDCLLVLRGSGSGCGYVAERSGSPPRPIKETSSQMVNGAEN